MVSRACFPMSRCARALLLTLHAKLATARAVERAVQEPLARSFVKRAVISFPNQKVRAAGDADKNFIVRAKILVEFLVRWFQLVEFSEHHQCRNLDAFRFFGI